MENAYHSSPVIYDLIYTFKDYEAESKKIKVWLNTNGIQPKKELLEVACGTGAYFPFFIPEYNLEGLDFSPQMLEVCQEKYPNTSLHLANMIDFQLNKKYDAILCLFSSIAYVKSYENLEKTLINFRKHLNPGGMIIIEGFIYDSEFKDDYLHMQTYKSDDIVIARQSYSAKMEGYARMEMYTLCTTKENGANFFSETHELALFEDEKVKQIMEKVGFTSKVIPNGLMPNRSVFIGQV